MNFRQHKEKLLKNLKVQTEHKKLSSEFQLAQSLIRAGLKKGWTQAGLARRVSMQQSNIARREGSGQQLTERDSPQRVSRWCYKILCHL
jgi:ribosome-binding protein aMBF1 (putative translation factor)